REHASRQVGLANARVKRNEQYDDHDHRHSPHQAREDYVEYPHRQEIALLRPIDMPIIGRLPRVHRRENCLSIETIASVIRCQCILPREWGGITAPRIKLYGRQKARRHTTPDPENTTTSNKWATTTTPGNP